MFTHANTRFALLQEHKNLKITMAAPEWFHIRHGEHAYPKDVYKNDGAQPYHRTPPSSRSDARSPYPALHVCRGVL